MSFIKWDRDDVRRTLDTKKEHIRSITLRAFNLLTDPKAKERRHSQLCPLCYYRESLMAGQAFTNVQCRICEVEMQFSTTHTHRLCDSCAMKHRLCKECGVTVDLKEPRWMKETELKP